MEKRINKNVYTWVGTFLFGIIGVDRFMRGQIGLGIFKLLTVGFFGLWFLVDWVTALTKLGKYEKDFVFIDNKWRDDKEAEEKAEALLKAEIEETTQQLNEAGKYKVDPESVAEYVKGYKKIDKVRGLKDSNLYPMIKEFCVELLKKEYKIFNISAKHDSSYDVAMISVKNKNDEYLGYIDFKDNVTREAKEDINYIYSNSHPYETGKWKHLIWDFPFVLIIPSKGNAPYTEAPPEWMMICADVIKKHGKIKDPPFVQERPDAKKYVNVMFR